MKYYKDEIWTAFAMVAILVLTFTAIGIAASKWKRDDYTSKVKTCTMPKLIFRDYEDNQWIYSCEEGHRITLTEPIHIVRINTGIQGK